MSAGHAGSMYYYTVACPARQRKSPMLANKNIFQNGISIILVLAKAYSCHPLCATRWFGSVAGRLFDCGFLASSAREVMPCIQIHLLNANFGLMEWQP